ncbi:MAG TPA: hypothetical protein VKA09_09275 [Nitrososphaeraceae archaeon]|nr:hypothetical protein [Nitrososphaeraceae archaeon]
MVQKQTGAEVWFAPHSRTRNINADKAFGFFIALVQISTMPPTQSY